MSSGKRQPFCFGLNILENTQNEGQEACLSCTILGMYWFAMSSQSIIFAAEALVLDSQPRRFAANLHIDFGEH